VSDAVIRRVQPADLKTLLDIYNHYVTETHVTFDLEPRTLVQRQEWLAQFGERGRHQCFVAARDDRVIGWACSAQFKVKAGYDTSVETSVYLAPGEEGRGLGRRLYETLFDALKGEDIHRAYGGVCLPNAASEALHRSLGFEHFATYREVGRKFGKYWDVAWYVKPMN
jgi:phosphinothricin acetyltransferase